MNKIVIELCEDDRQRLDMLFYRLGVLIERLPAPAPSIEPLPPLPVTPDPAVEPPAPAPIALGEFQKVIVTRCAESADTKEKVQALIHQYADSVSAVPEAKRAEVLAALKEI